MAEPTVLVGKPRLSSVRRQSLLDIWGPKIRCNFVPFWLTHPTLLVSARLCWR